MISARHKIVRVTLRLVGSGIIIVGFTGMTVGIGPFSDGRRLVNTMSGILIIGAGGLMLFGTRPDLVRFILGGIAAGTFAIGRNSTETRPDRPRSAPADASQPELIGV